MHNFVCNYELCSLRIFAAFLWFSLYYKKVHGFFRFGFLLSRNSLQIVNPKVKRGHSRESGCSLRVYSISVIGRAKYKLKLEDYPVKKTGKLLQIILAVIVYSAKAGSVLSLECFDLLFTIIPPEDYVGTCGELEV